MENEDLKKADRLIGSLTLQHDQACKKIAELEEDVACWKFRYSVAALLCILSAVALAICLFA